MLTPSAPRPNLFSGEEPPSRMFLLLFTLALALHVWLMMWLLRPAEAPLTPAQPLVMEVSMIAMSAPKPSVAPPPPVPRPPEKKPPLQKPQPKPLPKPAPAPKKPPPLVQKAPDFAPSEPVAEPRAAEPPPSAPVQPSAATESKAVADAETFTEANFKANYAHNPKPDYPPVAKSRGWQGKVMLRVRVSAEGLSDAVEVEQSSGHEMLDESAAEAVKKWRFIPAKRGETAVASSVIVPIVFTLRD